MLRVRRARTASALAAMALLTGCGFRKEGLAEGDPTCVEDCGVVPDGGGDVVGLDAVEDTIPPPPGTRIEGDFVGAVVSGSSGGIELHGSLHWGSAVNGTNAGITVEGTLE
jgi:hypothetical protein